MYFKVLKKIFNSLCFFIQKSGRKVFWVFRIASFDIHIKLFHPLRFKFIANEFYPWEDLFKKNSKFVKFLHKFNFLMPWCRLMVVTTGTSYYSNLEASVIPVIGRQFRLFFHVIVFCISILCLQNFLLCSMRIQNIS